MTWREVRAALAATVLLALGAPGAAAQEGSGGGSEGAAFEVRGLAAIAPLRDDNGARAMDVYRALIPNGLQPSAEPAVGVWMSELAAYRNGGRPQEDASHWMEGAIQIRVRTPAGLEGWYPIHYPVNAEFWFNAGRFVGLPKRRAATTMAASGKGWRADASPCANGTRGANSCIPMPGGPSVTMEWQPSPQDAGAVARAFAIPSDPLLVLNAPHVGPELRRVQYRIGPPPAFPPQLPGGAPSFQPGQRADAGLVHLRLRPELDALRESDLPALFPDGTSLADLIRTDQVVPGAHGHFAIGLTSEDETIGEGSFERRRVGEGPAGPPAGGPSGGKPGERSSRRRCRGRRSVTLRVRSNPKVKLRRVRVYVNGRRAKAKRLAGRRVRISLRGRKARRLRIRVVAVQSRGLRTTSRRTVRRCRR